jgi:leader peptidase (prepilin peptidase)/N-methyltransferase
VSWQQHMVVAMTLFTVGAALGSFLNVCFYRVPLGLSVIRPASRCPRCSCRIGVRDNVPILGWLFLKGRCRCCSEPISARYPLVEALCGAGIALLYLADARWGSSDAFEASGFEGLFHLSAMMALVCATLTAVVMAYDLRATRDDPSS